MTNSSDGNNNNNNEEDIISPLFSRRNIAYNSLRYGNVYLSKLKITLASSLLIPIFVIWFGFYICTNYVCVCVCV